MRLFALWALWRALRSKRRWRLFGDVRDFGARPDGVTDCTAAIQGSLDETGSAVLPSGGYVVATIRAKAGDQIRGAGSDSTFLRARRELEAA